MDHTPPLTSPASPIQYPETPPLSPSLLLQTPPLSPYNHGDYPPEIQWDSIFSSSSCPLGFEPPSPPLFDRVALGDPNDCPPLHKACKTGSIARVAELLADESTNIDELDANGCNVLAHAIHRASRHQDDCCLLLLINSGRITNWYVQLASNIRIPFLKHLFLNRNKLPPSLFSHLLQKSHVPVNDRDPLTGECLLDSLVVSNEVEVHALLETLLKRQDLDFDSFNPSATPALLKALKCNNFIVAAMLMRNHEVKVSPSDPSAYDEVFELVSRAANQPSHRFYPLLIAYLENPTARLSHTSEGVKSDRMAQFDTWDPNEWIPRVLVRLSPDALKRICEPLLPLLQDSQSSELYLQSPQQISSALLIDEPSYRQFLLTKINSLMAPIDEDFQWWYQNLDGINRVQWLGITLHRIRNLAKPFHEWLHELNVIPQIVSAIVAALPNQIKIPVKQRITQIAHNVVEKNSRNAYRSKRQQLKGEGSDTSTVKRMRKSSLEALSQLRLLEPLVPAGELQQQLRSTRQRVMAFQRALSVSSPVSSSSSSHSAVWDGDPRDTDVCTLLTKLIPSDQPVMALEWLKIKLEHEPSLLFNRGIESGEDLEKRLSIQLDHFKNPTEEQREAILNAIKEFLYSGDASSSTSQ